VGRDGRSGLRQSCGADCDEILWMSRNEADDLRTFPKGSPPVSIACAASKTPARTRSLPMSPDATQPAAAWSHLGSGRSKNRRGLGGGGPWCPGAVRTLEPGTLNLFEFSSAAGLYLDQVPVVRPGGAVARTLQSSQWGLSRREIVAIVNSLLHGTTVW
jgi:hypothetical protein